MFSKLTEIYSPKRFQLSHEHAKQQLFLYFNYRGRYLRIIFFTLVPENSTMDLLNCRHSRPLPLEKLVSSSDRALTQVLMLIREMSEKIKLARTIQDRAAKRFKEFIESKALRGKDKEGWAAACLYIACREEGVPHTLKEICAVTKVSRKVVGRCFKLITKTLETNLEQITSADFMSRFCGNLHLPYPVQVAATRIPKQALEKGLVGGRIPISIAAASIYMASQATREKRSAEESTVLLIYRLMLPKAKELFPPDFRFETDLIQ